MDKLEHLYIAIRNIKITATVENGLTVLQMLNIELRYDPKTSIPKYIHQRIKKR